MHSGTRRSGTATLRTRPDGATELRVNGVFVMDDRETSSERLLARRALAASATPQRVLVGGLGLGYTVRELVADPRVEQVVVAELEPALVSWMRDGTLAGADLLDDPRVQVRLGDVRDVVAGIATRSFDVLLLDVDNGPDFLVHDGNASVYGARFLHHCADSLGPDGELCIWSQDDSPLVRESLATAFERVTADRVPVRLQSRDESYWLLRGTYPREA